MSEHPGYRMIGPDFVCSDAAIGNYVKKLNILIVLMMRTHITKD